MRMQVSGLRSPHVIAVHIEVVELVIGTAGGPQTIDNFVEIITDDTVACKFMS